MWRLCCDHFDVSEKAALGGSEKPCQSSYVSVLIFSYDADSLILLVSHLRANVCLVMSSMASADGGQLSDYAAFCANSHFCASLP